MKNGVVKAPDANVAAQETVFGWVLSGQAGVGNKHGVSMLNISTIPEHIMSRFWDLESIGIKDSDSSSDCVVEKFNENIDFFFYCS